MSVPGSSDGCQSQNTRCVKLQGGSCGLTDSYCYITETWDVISKETTSFVGPTFIHRVQKSLTVIGDRLAFTVYQDSGVEIP